MAPDEPRVPITDCGPPPSPTNFTPPPQFTTSVSSGPSGPPPNAIVGPGDGDNGGGDPQPSPKPPTPPQFPGPLINPTIWLPESPIPLDGDCVISSINIQFYQMEYRVNINITGEGGPYPPEQYTWGDSRRLSFSASDSNGVDPNDIRVEIYGSTTLQEIYNLGYNQFEAKPLGRILYKGEVVDEKYGDDGKVNGNNFRRNRETTRWLIPHQITYTFPSTSCGVTQIQYKWHINCGYYGGNFNGDGVCLEGFGTPPFDEVVTIQ